MTVTDPPTGLHRDILVAIDRHVRDHGWPPTYAELAETLGCSPSTVHVHMGRLERAGWVRRSPSASRSVALVRPLTDLEEVRP